MRRQRELRDSIDCGVGRRFVTLLIGLLATRPLLPLTHAEVWPGYPVNGNAVVLLAERTVHKEPRGGGDGAHWPATMDSVSWHKLAGAWPLAAMDGWLLRPTLWSGRGARRTELVWLRPGAMALRKLSRHLSKWVKSYDCTDEAFASRWSRGALDWARKGRDRLAMFFKRGMQIYGLGQ